MKKNKSKRNRHTGKLNAFKKNILENGRSIRIGSQQYFRLNRTIVFG